jgi:uncharacterized PurR-regulated membrane protein YhhQ (DUF165 family)
MIYIAMYLLAIVLANLTILWFGPSMTIVNAFLFIGLDLTARDYLHEAWHKKGLWWKMLLLIGSGSVITYILNVNAAKIAVASFVSFAFAGLADVIMYQLLFKRSKIIKIKSPA